MEEEIKALKSELELLRRQFSQRVSEVEARLDYLIAHRDISQEQTIHDKSLLENHGNLQQVRSAEPVNRAEDANEAKQVMQVTQAKKELVAEAQTANAPEYVAAFMADKPTKPAKRSFINVLFVSLMAHIFEWFTPVTNIYQSYKERGMLGILILTVSGIGLTLAGFGYLMQLLIDQLDVGAKALLMCLAAVLVIALGVGLKTKTKLSEFATAIVTLGILLSYNTVYFSGSVYEILPTPFVLLAYLGIAILCHGMALWLDTKIVAALGIVGISTMPVLSNTIQIEPVYYLLSLVFVAASSLILAFRYVGQWLANITLAFTLLSIEWVLGFEGISISGWSVEAFYLLFFGYVIATLHRSNSLEKPTLVFLAAAIGSTILLTYQTTEFFAYHMSFSFGLNTLLACTAAIFFYRFNRDLAGLLVLVATVWAVLAVVSLVSSAYWGIAWAVEGLLLLLIGRRFLFSSAVNQGQCLTGGAIIYSLAGLSVYFPLPALKSFDGWFLSLFVVVTLAVWQRAINETNAFNDVTRTKIKPALQLFEVVWGVVLAIAALDIWLGNWTGSVVIIAQLALLYRARYCQQVSIEWFAASLILVPLFYAFEGALMVDSYRFMALPLFAKLSIVSAFIQLWLWSEFYRRLQPNSELSKIAESARILFYLLIPICWLGSAIRRFDLDALMVLWLSPLLALMLARKIQHRFLMLETKILTVLFSITSVVFIGFLSTVNSFISLFGFAVYFGVAYWFSRNDSSPLSKFINSCGFIATGIVVPIMIASLTDELLLGVVTAGIYWSAALNLTRKYQLLQNNEIVISVVNLLLVLVTWALIPSNVEYVFIPLIFIAGALYQREQAFNSSRFGLVFKGHADLLLHSMVAITYVLCLIGLADYRFDLLIAPLLAVHGAMILFLKDKRLTTVKYSFVLIGLGVFKLGFIDAVNALLWQKVVLFMGIGVFILFASFWYQKLADKPEQAQVLE